MAPASAENPPLGRLEIICGPMFAGKTTELIRRLRDARTAGDQVAAAKHRLDDRYDPDDLATHDGRRLSGHVIESPDELDDLPGDVIGLDEAHFFKSGLHDAALRNVSRGRRVILAGLDRTSLNEPFGEMGRLLIEADEVVKLTGVCAICGRPAVHTIRLFDSKEDIVVGGNGMFENRCRVHLKR